MGFRPEITKMLNMLPPKHTRQTMLYSATMPTDITKMAEFALNPRFNTVDTVGEDRDTHARVPQFCVVHPLSDTYQELLNVVRTGMEVGAMFCVQLHIQHNPVLSPKSLFFTLKISSMLAADRWLQDHLLLRYSSVDTAGVRTLQPHGRARSGDPFTQEPGWCATSPPFCLSELVCDVAFD